MTFAQATIVLATFVHCPYQEYLSCYWPDFDQTLKEGSWDHLRQIPTVKVTFVQATYVMATFVHTSNISTQGQCKVNVRSMQGQGKVRAMWREGQGKVKARSKRGQCQFKVRSRQCKHNLSLNCNLMGFNTIEINLVYLVETVCDVWRKGEAGAASENSSP